jgi:hypothetical protein
MLNYIPPEQVEKKKKKKKKSEKDADKPDDDGDDEELGTVDADKNLNLEVASDVSEQVRYALSQMDERQIPIDVIQVRLSDFYEVD